jgi:Holliday junction resolvase RusA-like endonuclease
MGSLVWWWWVMEFEFLIPDRPLSVQARRRQRKQEWQQFVAEEAAKTRERAPIADKNLQCTLIYLCNDAPVDIDNIVKPILDALKGLVYEDDILITDVEARRRPLASPPDYNIEQCPDHLLQGLPSGSECVYVRISEQPILEEKL